MGDMILELILGIVGFFVTTFLIGAQYLLYNRQTKLEDDLGKGLASIRSECALDRATFKKEFDEYRFAAMKEFAAKEDMKDVESKLLQRMDSVVDGLAALRSDLTKYMLEQATGVIK